MINLGLYPKKVKVLHSSCGSAEKTVFKYVYSEKHGCPRRVPNGKVNVQELIQSYADDVDFKAIGKMLVDTRDNVVSHFTDVNGEVVDVTGLPRNIHEFEALHNKMKAKYDELPEQLKNLFGGFDGYKTAYSNGKMTEILNTYVKSLEPAPQPSKEGGNE